MTIGSRWVITILSSSLVFRRISKPLVTLPRIGMATEPPVIDPRFIDAAKRFIVSLPDNLAFRPLVVPTSNGSLQLEWHEGPKSLELEFESPRTIRFLQWHPEEGIEEEDTIALEDTERAVDLINWSMRGAYR